MSKVYIAAPWTHREIARQVAKRVEQEGHTITHPWWDHEDVAIDDAENWDELEEQARRDFQGVLDADVMLLLNYSKSEGKAVEQGIALMACIPILVVSVDGVRKPTNLFQFLDDYIWCHSVEDAIEKI